MRLGRRKNLGDPFRARGDLRRRRRGATELGHQLLALRAQFRGYVAAMVGWDPEIIPGPR
ncbi:hypothetical protein STRTUCAR8_07117 [Streptomyces turgidiscabies Car8]|uniref:Uncharacterized protein n=1 Tax=Streptomyces turgidiscabies (strain Car8) TaxID=698760 RepID=L7FFC2_STRT8|nr:hypothetical protein STRTUCAR8_07117 [Streptomyces turgidiscabies Car8]